MGAPLSGFSGTRAHPTCSVLCLRPPNPPRAQGAHSTKVGRGWQGPPSRQCGWSQALSASGREWPTRDKDPYCYPQAKLPNLKEVDVRYTEAW